jgi:hypothetical protein
MIDRIGLTMMLLPLAVFLITVTLRIRKMDRKDPMWIFGACICWSIWVALIMLWVEYFMKH